MKKRNTKLGFILAVIIGLTLSFTPIKVLARVIVLDGGDEITCWSSGGGFFGQYVECATCTSVDGKPSGGKGTCTN